MSATPTEDTFTIDELRITLTAFAMWLLKDEFGEGREVELVDQFLHETTGPCECVCSACLNGDHCDRASCAQPGTHRRGTRDHRGLPQGDCWAVCA
jgi:hypothetical protein